MTSPDPRPLTPPLGYGPDVRTLTPQEEADLRRYLGWMTLDHMGAYLPNLLATLDAERAARDGLREAARAVEEAWTAAHRPDAAHSRRTTDEYDALVDVETNAIDALSAALRKDGPA